MDGGYNLRTEDHQMEMMMMMTEMEKLPEPSMTPYNETTSGLSGSDFTFTDTINSTRIAATIPPFFQNPNNVDSPSSVLCNGAQFQDHFQHNAAPSKFSGISNELSCVNPFSAPLEKRNSMATMREMIFRMAAMQPIQIDPETVKAPKRRNVKISKDPQSVAARHRRERISEKIRILQRLVPGGTKMDTASMLDEAIHYVKFLKKQVQSLERANVNFPVEVGFPATATATAMANLNYCSLVKACHQPAHQMLGSMQMLR